MAGSIWRTVRHRNSARFRATFEAANHADLSDWNCEALEMNVPHLSDLRAANAKYDFGTFSAGM